MSTSEKLYHAVLAMDAYNRRQANGDSVGVALPGDTPGGDSSIGNADRINIMLPSDYDEYGFFATAYDLNGDTIISYRGTDSQAGMGELAEDVFFGWASGTGAYSPQTLLAEQFYESVTAADLFAGPQSDVVLTGHSLGGGLAGYISTLSGTDAVRSPARSMRMWRRWQCKSRPAIGKVEAVGVKSSCVGAA